MKKYSALLALILFFASCAKQPEAEFNSDKTSIYEGESVVFTNTSNDAESVEWDFGDGTTSTAESPVKKYRTSGTYTVTLTAYSKKKKKSSSSVSTITVEKARMKLMVGSDTLYMTANNSAIVHSADKSLNACGDGPNTASYSTDVSHEPTSSSISIGKGTLTWTCANPAPQQEFKSFFSTGTFPYSPGSLNGIQIIYYTSTDTYKTDDGSGDQSGSTFVISSVSEQSIFGSYYVNISGTFTCKVYNSAGNSIQISGTFTDVPFENM